MTVVDISEDLKRKQAREAFARLADLCEQHAEDIKLNPEPYLRAMEFRYCLILEALDDIKYELMGQAVAVRPSEAIEYVSIESQIMSRHRKALDRLAKLESDL